MKLILFSLILFIVCEAKKQAHWTDFIPNRNSDENKTQHPRDSHNSLNFMSKANRLLGDQIRDEIPAGHTNRKSLIPLIVQRDKQEEKVNHALISGIILKNLNHKASNCLFNCAFEERTKSQQVQRQIDQIKSEGHIDRKVESAMLNLRSYHAHLRYDEVKRFKRRRDQSYNSDKAKKDRDDQEKRRSDKYRQLKRRKRQ